MTHWRYADTLVGGPSAKGKVYNTNHELYRQSEAHDPITDKTFGKLVVLGVGFDQVLSIGDKSINGNIIAD